MGILDEAKVLAEALKTAHDLTLYKQFMGLYGDIMGMMTENKELRENVEELAGKLDLKAKMAFRAPFYYQAGDDIPFCQRCFEADNKAIHLNVLHNGRWQCKECNNVYGKENGPRQQPRPPGYGSGGSGEWMR